MRTTNHSEALRLAILLIHALREPARRIAAHDRQLASQLRRAASGIALQLAEGSASTDGNARRHHSYAHGSAKETRVCIEVAAAWGYLSDKTAAELDVIADRVCALTYGLRR